MTMCCVKSGCFLLLNVLALGLSVSAAEVCSTPNSTVGECIKQPDCPELDTLFKIKKPTFETIRYLKRSQCGYDEYIPKVCCETSSNFSQYIPAHSPLAQSQPTQSPPDQSPPAQSPTGGAVPEVTLGNRFGEGSFSPGKHQCGIQVIDNRIILGTITSIDEFPWMALLKYRTPHGAAIGCGGTLLNERYVLTAAHCVTGAGVRALGVLENVTLGEYDISTQLDCDPEWDLSECIAQAVDVKIEAVYPHPNYRPDATVNRLHDIALIRLMTPVDYTDYIQPICLPFDGIEARMSKPKNLLYIAGWGRTKTDVKSNIKLKARVPMTPFQDCSKVYQEKGITLAQSQICAGGELQDSCRGDSGGPLMYLNVDPPNFQWYALGVTSFGYRECGTAGIPSIYTKITPYLSWINSVMKKR